MSHGNGCRPCASARLAMHEGSHAQRRECRIASVHGVLSPLPLIECQTPKTAQTSIALSCFRFTPARRPCPSINGGHVRMRVSSRPHMPHMQTCADACRCCRHQRFCRGRGHLTQRTGDCVMKTRLLIAVSAMAFATCALGASPVTLSLLSLIHI